MTLEEILRRLFQSQQEREMQIQQRMREINSFPQRGSDGNILQQGGANIYSDSVPFTLEDYIRTQKPGLWKNYNTPVPDLTPRMERQLMKKPPPYSGYL